MFTSNMLGIKMNEIKDIDLAISIIRASGDLATHKRFVKEIIDYVESSYLSGIAAMLAEQSRSNKDLILNTANNFLLNESKNILKNLNNRNKIELIEGCNVAKEDLTVYDLMFCIRYNTRSDEFFQYLREKCKTNQRTSSQVKNFKLDYYSSFEDNNLKRSLLLTASNALDKPLSAGTLNLLKYDFDLIEELLLIFPSLNVKSTQSNTAVNFLAEQLIETDNLNLLVDKFPDTNVAMQILKHAAYKKIKMSSNQFDYLKKHIMFRSLKKGLTKATKNIIEKYGEKYVC